MTKRGIAAFSFSGISDISRFFAYVVFKEVSL
jgi:hypothetical protein